MSKIKAQFPSILKQRQAREAGRQARRKIDKMKDNKHRMNGPPLVLAGKK